MRWTSENSSLRIPKCQFAILFKILWMHFESASVMHWTNPIAMCLSRARHFWFVSTYAISRDVGNKTAFFSILRIIFLLLLHLLGLHVFREKNHSCDVTLNWIKIWKFNIRLDAFIFFVLEILFLDELGDFP